MKKIFPKINFILGNKPLSIKIVSRKSNCRIHELFIFFTLNNSVNDAVNGFADACPEL
jgi:hypothetical protein